MKIGKVDIDRQVLITAEIGNNHEGNFQIAQELVRRAADCGVQAVKFQTFKTEHYVSQKDTARFNRLKSFELTYAQFEQLAELSRSLGLEFISTPFDLASAEFLTPIVDAFKISSGDNNFYPLIGHVVRTGKPVIISMGLSNVTQVARTIEFAKEQQTDKHSEQLVILHCVTSYPTPPEQANLRAIPFMKERFGIAVGYSDHTLGVDASVLAVALGARIIEKHFTLDKVFSDFRDHQLSADPDEMQVMVNKIRLAESMLGEYKKQVQPCEEAIIAAVRRSIVASADLPAGHRLHEHDLTWIRPAGGLQPGEEDQLIGRALKHNVCFGEPIHPTDVE